MTEICIFMFCGRARVHETLCGEYPSSSIGCGSAAPGQSDLTADWSPRADCGDARSRNGLLPLKRRGVPRRVYLISDEALFLSAQVVLIQGRKAFSSW